MSKNTPRERFHEVIQQTVTELADDIPATRGLLTSFVVVCEIMGDDGEPWLFVTDSKQSVWRTMGLLLGAQHVVQTGATQGEE